MSTASPHRLTRMPPEASQRKTWGEGKNNNCIRRASLPEDIKHPCILPRKGHVTELIICHHHQKVEHQGRGMTYNSIRSSGFWIIGGGSAVSSHISKCVKCRKFRGAPQEQKMADLPEDRLKPAPPFTYSGVDYFGPVAN